MLNHFVYRPRQENKAVDTFSRKEKDMYSSVSVV